MNLKRWAIALFALSILAGDRAWHPVSSALPPSQTPVSAASTDPQASRPRATLARIQQLETLGHLAPLPAAISVPFDYVGRHIRLSIRLDTAQNPDTNAIAVLFDSGAAMSILDTRWRSPIPQNQALWVDAETSYDLVDHLLIADATFRQVGVILTPFSDSGNPLRCLTPDGLLGMNILRHGVWQIDYQQQMMRIAQTADQLPALEEAIRVPLEPGDRPIVSLSFGPDLAIPVLVDTGWEGGIYLTQADFARVETALQRSGIVLQGVTETLVGLRDMRLEWAIAPTLSLGSHTLTHYPVLADQEPSWQPYSLIGNQFLEQFIVQLDWPNRQLLLKPVAPGLGAAQGVPEQVGYGFQALPRGDRLYISGLYAPSPAEAAGLRVGDRILQLDSTDYRTLTPAQGCAWLLPPRAPAPAPVMHITIERDGQPIPYTLRRSVP